MVRIELNGNQYVLRFDCGALEDMEENFGSLGDAMRAIAGSNRRKSINSLFAILNRRGNARLGLANPVPEEILGRDDGMAKLKLVVSAIQQAVSEGAQMDSVENEDEVVDLTLQEIRERESKNAKPAEA